MVQHNIQQHQIPVRSVRTRKRWEKTNFIEISIFLIIAASFDALSEFFLLHTKANSKRKCERLHNRILKARFLWASSFVAVAAALKHLRGCFVSITDCSFLFVSDNKSFWLRKDFPWRKIFDRGKKKRKKEFSGKQQKRVFICARAAHVTDNFENLANTRLVDTPKQVEPL